MFTWTVASIVAFLLLVNINSKTQFATLYCAAKMHDRKRTTLTVIGIVVLVLIVLENS